MSTRIVTLHDPEHGTIAAAVDNQGNIVATASDTVRNGVRIVMDEMAVWEATGELLSPEAWEIAAAGDVSHESPTRGD